MQPLIPVMTPSPGERLRRFVGDPIQFVVRDRDGRRPPPGWRARLRTNLGRVEMLRREIIQAHARGVPLAGASWRDLPMRETGEGWMLELPLAEVGFFKAKAYLLDEKNWQHWPDGPDVGISVHPDAVRTRNTIYCAFPRMFGPGKTALSTRNERLENQIQQIEQHGFSIIPPSGKLRDLIPCLPHIIDVLGCRILHLLPVHPTPATYARFGSFGSPYAAIDPTAIDPALIVFDRRSTGVDQFRELTYATHLRGARVFLDIVINHTGWGSVLQENHPEWFLRGPDGMFVSPGAWGTIWEDLVELKHDNVALWDKLAEMFLIWCRRGVDGFRCDAGYKVPVPAWQYIVARVQQEFPATVFLLEGLGGAWESTEALLTEGGMQWAYSELFQNYSGLQLSGYLDHSLKQCDRVGLLVHYSETHDNPRLAAEGRAWSLLRNRLCGLASVDGGFGFTCGVEWLATEKIRVHGSTGMGWGSRDNLVAELSQLNRLLAEHPCFFDGARLTRISPDDAPVYALLRESAEGIDSVLVLVNNDLIEPHTFTTPADLHSRIGALKFDLLGQSLPEFQNSPAGEPVIRLAPASAYCLAPTATPNGLAGDAYRRKRAQAAWAIQAVASGFSVREIGRYDWHTLAERVDRSPAAFLASLSHLDPAIACDDLERALDLASDPALFPHVVHWSLLDRHRITLIPAGHWLLLEDVAPFRASLLADGNPLSFNIESIPAGDRHVACFPPQTSAAAARLRLERYTETDPQVDATVQFLAPRPDAGTAPVKPQPDDLVLLTNGIGGMARMCVDLGRIKSKYDCVLGANLHPTLPVDRHVFVKRMRVWVTADGFISPLDYQHLVSFEPGPPAIWRFIANAGDGRTVGIELRAEMIEGQNTIVFHFSRPGLAHGAGKPLPPEADVRLTIRVDIEDRNFHWETKRNSGAEHHFSTHTSVIARAADDSADAGGWTGFAFNPATDRQLRVLTNAGEYHSQPEWSENIPHPIEQSRGQAGSGDAWSPGWFEVPMRRGARATLTVTAEKTAPYAAWRLESPHTETGFGERLLQATRAFVVRRATGKTIIAGYPWFLDWGRDTFICARGLIAAGLIEEVKQILITFARFEKDGTLPNTIYGEDASNRDTSDAPLWFGIVAEELAALNPGSGKELRRQAVDQNGRTIQDVLLSIGRNYIKGTPNGIRMDPDSALVWSPAHFTWMDTNYPAGSPREGYPVEIQALWIRFLRQTASMCEGTERKSWQELASRAQESFEKLFWLETRGWYADLILASAEESAAAGVASDALRSNCLFPITLGLVSGDRARRCVRAALRYLVVPGALRSLAPLPVSVPLPVCSADGRLLNRPHDPYWARYEGEEDTRRKPAYHNGTAWTWTFPTFCEALARAWEFEPNAVNAARAYLGSMESLMNSGCLGQLPEILDGDAPHTQRGCDAQSWAATEAFRAWKLLHP